MPEAAVVDEKPINQGASPPLDTAGEGETPTLLGGAKPTAAKPAAKADASAAGAGAGATEAEAVAAWENWRQDLSGGDEDLLKELAKSKNPADVGKRLIDLRKQLAKRAEAPKLPENATEEQITSYRKLMGVPEKPEAYGIAPPEGYQAGEVEKAMLGDFAKQMHAKHTPASVVKEATDFFFKAQAANNQALNALDLQRQQEWNQELQKTLGKDYENQVASGNEFLNQRFAENPDAKAALLNARLPGGGRLGDHPAFVQMAVDLALNNGFTDRIEASDIEAAGGKSLAEQQAEIEKLWHTDQDRYNQPTMQAKLTRLIELRLKRGEIDDQGNEVRRRRSA